MSPMNRSTLDMEGIFLEKKEPFTAQSRAFTNLISQLTSQQPKKKKLQGPKFQLFFLELMVGALMSLLALFLRIMTILFP